jgi:hypothetical protein
MELHCESSIHMASRMKKKIYTFWLFSTFCILLLCILGMRIWNIHPLVSTTMQRDIAIILKKLEREHGWLISDIFIQKISEKEMIIHHSPHIRGRDPLSCYVITLTTHSITPCLEKN